jgi:hypothetical protein
MKNGVQELAAKINMVYDEFIVEMYFERIFF